MTAEKITPEYAQKLIDEAIEKAGEFYQKNDYDCAELLYKQILNIDEKNVIALQMLGLIESRRPGHFVQSIELLNKALELEPDNHSIYNNIGLVYSWASDQDKPIAEQYYKRAIELCPTAYYVHSNLAVYYKSLNEIDKAKKILEDALKQDPESSHLHFNYATLLGESKRWEEAEKEYLKVLEKEPGSAAAHYNLSHVLLTTGRWDRGWEEYEWRWECHPAFKKIPNRLDKAKLWNGENLKNKSIFLYTEQGFGDAIQFVRFCPMLKSMGAKKIIVEEHAHMIIPLIEQMEGVDEVITLGDKIPDHDFHQSIMSLPRVLKIHNIDNIPNKPYLKTNYTRLPEGFSIIKKESWEDYKENFKIGICWAGNPMHRHDFARSTYLRYFKSLQIGNVKLFSLQKDVRKRVLPGLGEVDFTEHSEGMNIIDLKDFLLDYNCTAAIIDKLDLVITVDTGTAHLAGAMGKPVWNLLSYQNDWRWMENKKSTTWYPSMRLFRQPTLHDWESVFTEVKSELQKII